ncbi:MAG: SPOR domain-containing protein, partial [Thermoanaerobaculia bacterium]
MAPHDEAPDPVDPAEVVEGPVHYQISITGRQAGSFFIALLLALGLAFFFGMKTGAAARRGFDPRAAVGDAPVAAALPPEEKGERGEKTETAGPSAPTRSNPALAEVGEKKLGFDDGPPATARPVQTPRPEPTATSAAAVPTEAPEPTRTARPEPTRTARPGPTQRAGAPAATPAAPVTTPGASPKPTKAPGPFFVQLLATHNTKMADELVKKLKKQGFKADVSS